MIKAPALEAAYGVHEKSALKLYDCLVPKIALHAREMGVFCMKCRVKA